jgi:hypothetical protein
MRQRLRFFVVRGLSGVGLALGLRQGEQFACSRDVLGAGVGEQAVVSNASLRWLGIGDLIAEPEGPSFISRQLRPAVWTGDTRDKTPRRHKPGLKSRSAVSP